MIMMISIINSITMLYKIKPLSYEGENRPYAGVGQLAYPACFFLEGVRRGKKAPPRVMDLEGIGRDCFIIFFDS